jgi:hypothetical protein
LLIVFPLIFKFVEDNKLLKMRYKGAFKDIDAEQFAKVLLEILRALVVFTAVPLL